MAPIFTGSKFGFGGGAAGGIQGSGIIASGGTILQPGDGYIYHVWNVDTPAPQNSFVVSSAGTGLMNFMLIGGGGVGGGGPLHPSGSYAGTGGGGAGGLILGVDVPFSATTYPVTIGNGQTGPQITTPGKGGNSTFFGLTAIGGGAGGFAPTPNGTSGGSGGGGMTTYNPGGQGGPGTQPTQPIPAPLTGLVTNYGNPGFKGTTDPSNVSPGGGGGGAGAGGPTGSYQTTGGNGVPVPWCPAPLIYPTVPGPWQPLFLQNTGPTGDYWAGGGGAGTYPAGPSVAGGYGGGGGTSNPGPGEGVFGTGGGGGGYLKNGGSGILVVRYLE